MENLIKALQILLKYGNHEWPTHCEHDVLMIVDIKPSQVSEVDTKQLEELGFIVSTTDDCFISYRFGSA